MPVLDIVLNEINAERKEQIDKIEKASIGFPKFENMEKIEGSDNVMKIKFGLDIGYQPEAANVNLKGIVVFKSDKVEKIMKSWEEDKKLEKGMGMEVLNVIYSNCLSKTVKIFEDMKLPTAALVNMPKIEIKKKQAEEKAKKKDE